MSKFKAYAILFSLMAVALAALCFGWWAVDKAIGHSIKDNGEVNILEPGTFEYNMGAIYYEP